jgi:di/tricarboxylate transporter
MALGAKESGLNKWVEEYLENNETLQALPGPAILMIVLVFIATLTSVASNTVDKLFLQICNNSVLKVESITFNKISLL